MKVLSNKIFKHHYYPAPRTTNDSDNSRRHKRKGWWFHALVVILPELLRGDTARQAYYKAKLEKERATYMLDLAKQDCETIRLQNHNLELQVLQQQLVNEKEVKLERLHLQEKKLEDKFKLADAFLVVVGIFCTVDLVLTFYENLCNNL